MHSTKVSFWKLLWLLLAPLGALYVTMCYYPSTHPQSSCFFFFIEPTAGSQVQYQSMKLRATHATQAAKETNKYTSQEKFDNLANHWDIVLKIVTIVVGSVRSSLCYDVLLPIRKTPVFFAFHWAHGRIATAVSINTTESNSLNSCNASNWRRKNKKQVK